MSIRQVWTCDRCKVESGIYLAGIKLVYPRGDVPREWDLCMDCRREFLSWVEGEPIEA